MGPPPTRSTILVGRIPRFGSERLFHVLWKATIAQMQMCGTAQTEFVICDQSIDTNHGYAKTVVANSEVTKKREALQKRLENVQRWTVGARKRMRNASKLYRKRCQQTKERADVLYRLLNDHQMNMERQGAENWPFRK